MLGTKLLWAVFVSAVISIPMALMSMTVSAGNWMDFISHPGFWLFLAKAAGWYFLAGLMASLLTLVVTSKRSDQQAQTDAR